MRHIPSIPHLLLSTLVASLLFGFPAGAGEDRDALLLEAAQQQDLPRVEELLEAGADVNARSRYGATPLFFACDKGNLELARILLARGAEVNVQDTFYQATPLAWAFSKAGESPGHRQIVLLLLRHEAEAGPRALRAAVRTGDPELVEAVLEAGGLARSDLEAASDSAREEGNKEIATLLAVRAETLPAEEPAPPESEGPTAPEEPAEDAAKKVAPPPDAATPPPAASPAKRLPPLPWPSFRGPNASGIGDGQGIPTEWDGEGGDNVLWKTPLPGIALSSPVVWGERVFLTSAVSEEADSTFRTGLYGDVDSVEDDSVHSFRVYALDKATGEILWQREAALGKPKVKRHTKSSHANPTPATDGRHLVVSFGSEGLFGYDLDGELLWKKDLGVLSSGWFYDPTYEWGFASSPILHEGKAIVQVDIQKGSFLAAFDAATGKELWRTVRDEIPSWATPAILPAAGDGPDEIVTNATTVRGYDAETGEELWKLTPNSEVVVGTPVVAGGVAYVTGGYPPAKPVYAVKPGGRGDLTLPEGKSASSHILWSHSRGGTYIPSPIVYRGILYLLNNNGRLAAHDAATGELLYRQRVGRGNSFSGSPVAADGRLFLTTEEGRTYVLRAGPAYEELAVNELGEVVMTVPAISDGLFILRGMDHVYGIGAPAEPKKGAGS